MAVWPIKRSHNKIASNLWIFWWQSSELQCALTSQCPPLNLSLYCYYLQGPDWVYLTLPEQCSFIRKVTFNNLNFPGLKRPGNKLKGLWIPTFINITIHYAAKLSCYTIPYPASFTIILNKKLEEYFWCAQIITGQKSHMWV